MKLEIVTVDIKRHWYVLYVERAIVTDVVRKKEKRDCCRKEMGREI